MEEGRLGQERSILSDFDSPRGRRHDFGLNASEGGMRDHRDGRGHEGGRSERASGDGTRSERHHHCREGSEIRMGGRDSHGHERRHGRDWSDTHGWGGEFRGGRYGFGRGGRIFGPGDLRLVLLSLIGDQPRHGYELIKAVEELFGGSYSPSPGSVYPILTLLEEIDQIRATASEGAKKRFEITDEGRRVLAENRTLIDAILGRMGIAARNMAGARPPEEIYQAFQTLKTAVVLHARGWSDEEVARVRRVIEAAVQEIGAGARDEIGGSFPDAG
jgi:DNA-binding PadR family transcriptional regulator